MAGGRPFRALAGLALGTLLWLAWRLPAMQAETQRLALVLAPRAPVMAALAGPVAAPDRPAVSVPQVPAVVPVLLVRQPVPFQAAMLPALTPDRPLAAPVAPAAPAAVALTPPVPPPGTAASPAYALASQAYERLEAGQRRQAAALLDAALALEPDNDLWRKQRRALARRWQWGGFALLRGGGARSNQPGAGLPGAAASPVLGGGQVGAGLAYLVDPYARRPLALAVRVNVAADPGGIRQDTAQAAIGVRQTLLPGVTLSAERLIALGDAARGDWTLRLAAGGRSGRFDGYGEAGVLGRGTLFAGAQASARIVRIGPATLNAGSWASIQTGSPDAWRVDTGPSVAAAWRGVRVQADWRQRIAGNAAPGSGPVLTVSAGF